MRWESLPTSSAESLIAKVAAICAVAQAATPAAAPPATVDNTLPASDRRALDSADFEVSCARPPTSPLSTSAALAVSRIASPARGTSCASARISFFASVIAGLTPEISALTMTSTLFELPVPPGVAGLFMRPILAIRPGKKRGGVTARIGFPLPFYAAFRTLSAAVSIARNW